MPKLKICGLFREEDIDAANEARPDYIGFVFAKSRRQVTPAAAEKLRARLDDGIIPVGVFVDAPVEEAAAIYRAGIIAIAQLHGAEDSDYIARLKEQCPALPVIKSAALRGNAGERGRASPAPPADGADFLLLDNAAAGSGKRFDWSLLEDGGYFTRIKTPCFIAGGIDADNITEALRFRPFGIDVSSGAETGGLKDRAKMIRLTEKVRAWRMEIRALAHNGGIE
jgi:phosphoribosylanthranilate isomerase